MLGTSLPRLSTTEGGGVVAASGGDIVLRPFGRKLADRFSAFPFAAAALIASTAEASIDRTEIRAFGTGSSPWLDGSGRVLLVGDAARQSDVPYLHHGSSLAIEDGYALAMAVDGCARAGGARRPLDAYELERREATAALQRVWASFDRLAASRSPVSRFVNSQVLAVALARQMQDARAGEPRDAEASLGVGGGR
jgi:2-polyprenyl-6-methoxyphenol hydroxylase-like FAD-dependent oxidoreductase